MLVEDTSTFNLVYEQNNIKVLGSMDVPWRTWNDLFYIMKNESVLMMAHSCWSTVEYKSMCNCRAFWIEEKWWKFHFLNDYDVPSRCKHTFLTRWGHGKSFL